MYALAAGGCIVCCILPEGPVVFTFAITVILRYSLLINFDPNKDFNFTDAGTEKTKNNSQDTDHSVPECLVINDLFTFLNNLLIALSSFGVWS